MKENILFHFKWCVCIHLSCVCIKIREVELWLLYGRGGAQGKAKVNDQRWTFLLQGEWEKEKRKKILHTTTHTHRSCGKLKSPSNLVWVRQPNVGQSITNIIFNLLLLTYTLLVFFTPLLIHCFESLSSPLRMGGKRSLVDLFRVWWDH